MRHRSRILLALETSGGGSGRHVLDLAGQYSHRGHRVHIAFSGRRMEGWFRDELNTLSDVAHVQIDMRRAPHAKDVAALYRLRHYLKHAGPFDVIHGHSSKGGALARLAGLGLGGVRVYTPHAFRTLDPQLSRPARYLYGSIERGLARLSHGIINVSEEERAHAQQQGFPQDKLFVVDNGLALKAQPESRQQTRARLGLTSDIFCIGFVGRLVAQKAPERLIEAFALLHARFPKTRLVMLGDGPLTEPLHAQAERAGVAQAIVWQTHGSGFKLMPAFDVFVMPSLYEAFPYVIIEAAAAGLPLVATPVGGTRALIRPGENGAIVPHDQPQALADSLATLIEQPELRRRMGDKSREIAGAFTVTAMADATLRVYAQLAEQHARPPALTDSQRP